MRNQRKFSLNERLKSFRPALNGLKWFLQNEQNVRIHLFLSLLSVIAGIFFQISRNEWIGIILCMGMVLSLEAANSAIEQLVDLVSPKKNQLAGLVKDLAAAAVLIASLIAILVAALVFLPKLSLLF